MKLTKSQLRQLIKEEIAKTLKEVGGPWGPERYDPEDPSNTPEAIAKDEATTAMMNGLRAHLKSRGDLGPEAIEHVVLDVEEAIVAGLEGVRIPVPEVSTDAESDDPGFELGRTAGDPLAPKGINPKMDQLRRFGAASRGGGA